jgi:hypothetical protein
MERHNGGVDSMLGFVLRHLSSRPGRVDCVGALLPQLWESCSRDLAGTDCHLPFLLQSYRAIAVCQSPL